uniref:Uncharacterized protein n=1 Tax=Rheinheimera sp. BAL341 TaxID=1708203 RepID=A0A486XQN7_9GAMM
MAKFAILYQLKSNGLPAGSSAAVKSQPLSWQLFHNSAGS